MDVRRLARDERADFAAFLATLSPQQWQAPTLCARWRVRDVVAHVISYDELGARGLLARVVRGRFRPDQVNAAALVGKEQIKQLGHRTGSTDMGDVSQIMPVIHPYVVAATGRGHGEDYVVQDYNLAVLTGAKAMERLQTNHERSVSP